MMPLDNKKCKHGVIPDRMCKICGNRSERTIYHREYMRNYRPKKR